MSYPWRGKWFKLPRTFFVGPGLLNRTACFSCPSNWRQRDISVATSPRDCARDGHAPVDTWRRKRNLPPSFIIPAQPVERRHQPAGLGARDQARRLSADRPQGWRGGALAERLRLAAAGGKAYRFVKTVLSA